MVPHQKHCLNKYMYMDIYSTKSLLQWSTLTILLFERSERSILPVLEIIICQGNLGESKIATSFYHFSAFVNIYISKNKTRRQFWTPLLVNTSEGILIFTYITQVLRYVWLLYYMYTCLANDKVLTWKKNLTGLILTLKTTLGFSLPSNSMSLCWSWSAI